MTDSARDSICQKVTMGDWKLLELITRR